MIGRPLGIAWVTWFIMFVVIILADIHEFLAEPNWVEYATLGGGVALFFYTVGTWFRRQILLKTPYDVYFEPENEAVQRPGEHECTGTTREEKHLQVTFKFKIQVHVERILFGFEGTGHTPHIKALYDWNLPLGQANPGVLQPYHNERDMWYWPYASPLRRAKNNTIKVGVSFDVDGGFRGYLFVQPTIQEQSNVGKVAQFPYNVIVRTRAS